MSHLTLHSLTLFLYPFFIRGWKNKHAQRCKRTLVAIFLLHLVMMITFDTIIWLERKRCTFNMYTMCMRKVNWAWEYNWLLLRSRYLMRRREQREKRKKVDCANTDLILRCHLNWNVQGDAPPSHFLSLFSCQNLNMGQEERCLSHKTIVMYESLHSLRGELKRWNLAFLRRKRQLHTPSSFASSSSPGWVSSCRSSSSSSSVCLFHPKWRICQSAFTLIRFIFFLLSLLVTQCLSCRSHEDPVSLHSFLSPWSLWTVYFDTMVLASEAVHRNLRVILTFLSAEHRTSEKREKEKETQGDSERNVKDYTVRWTRDLFFHS